MCPLFQDLFSPVLFLIKPDISSFILTFEVKAQRSVYNKLLFSIAQCHTIRDARRKVKMSPSNKTFQRMLIHRDTHEALPTWTTLCKTRTDRAGGEPGHGVRRQTSGPSRTTHGAVAKALLFFSLASLSLTTHHSVLSSTLYPRHSPRSLCTWDS